MLVKQSDKENNVLEEIHKPVRGSHWGRETFIVDFRHSLLFGWAQ